MVDNKKLLLIKEQPNILVFPPLITVCMSFERNRCYVFLIFYQVAEELKEIKETVENFFEISASGQVQQPTCSIRNKARGAHK